MGHWPQVSIDMNVVSKHVNRATGEQVRITFNSTSDRMSYDATIYRVEARDLPGRLGDTVFTTPPIRFPVRVRCLKGYSLAVAAGEPPSAAMGTRYTLLPSKSITVPSAANRWCR